LNWREWLTLLRFKFGMMSRKEVVKRLKSTQEQFIDSLPDDAQPRIRHLYEKMDDLRSIADLPGYVTAVSQLSAEFAGVTKRFSKEELGDDVHEKLGYLSGVDGMTYRPAGSRAWQFTINPFQVFSYYAEKHYATSAAIEMIVSAASQRGYGFDHASTVEDAKIVKLAQDLKFLKIDKLRLRLLKQYLTYGNCVVLPHFNIIGQLIKLEPLIMDRILPIIDPMIEKLVGWDYWIGRTSTVYFRDQVLHLANHSLKNPEIGMPFLAPLSVDIESDIYASDFNSTVMYKGGMIGLVIMTEDSGMGRIGESKINARIKKEIQNSHTGVKGANSVFVSNYIKDIKKLSQVGDFDASFLKFRQEVAKSIATIFQIDPALLNVGMKSAGVVEIGKIHSSRSAKMDVAVTGYMRTIDNFINEEIIAGILGVHDIGIQSNGQYGTFSPESAAALLNFTQAGGMFTNNEARTYFAGMPPLAPGDPRGRQIFDNSNRVQPGDAYVIADDSPNLSTSIQDPDPEESDLG
jgi:hypothetical protein